MTINTQELRKLAEAATPGPWIAGNGNVLSDTTGMSHFRPALRCGFGRPDDAEYIAAANPATVLALLDELDRLRAHMDGQALQLEAAERNVEWWVDEAGKLRAQLASRAEAASTPPYDSWSNNDGDSWYEHPADSEFVHGLALGEEFELLAGWTGNRVKYRVTKVPDDTDDTDDDYEVEEVEPLTAEPIFADEDHVSVPRGLLSAARSAIDKRRDAPKTMAELRRYTIGDLSKPQPADVELVRAVGELGPDESYLVSGEAVPAYHARKVEQQEQAE